MDTNLEIILDIFAQLKGQFVITASHSIQRLVAIGEDSTDYYYVTYDGRKLTWNTCVGELIPLKGYLRDRDYYEFIRLAKLNHFDQLTLWGNSEPAKIRPEVEAHISEILAIEDGHKFLTPVCLDLN